MFLAIVGDAGRTDAERAGASAAQQSTMNVPHLNRERLRLRCLFAPYALDTFNLVFEDCDGVDRTAAELTRFLPSLDSRGWIATHRRDVAERSDSRSIMLPVRALEFSKVRLSQVQLIGFHVGTSQGI